MIYEITKPLAKIALGLYFRKLYLINMEAVPKDKPVMLAANHPTAFIEPVILACWMDSMPSFLARGDLYQTNKMVKQLYDWYHITPIFRREDVVHGDLKSNNLATFEKCFETLQKKKPLMILAEGKTEHEKRLRPIRKGTARIIFGAFEKHGDMDIHLIPVGVNYTNSDNFRSVVMIEFAEPIRCSDYHELYQQHPAKAVNQLTKEMTRRLKEKVVHINDPADDEWVELYLTLKENEFQDRVYPVSSPQVELLSKQKDIVDKINLLENEEKEKLKLKAENYFKELEKNKISDFGLMHQNYASFKNVLFAIVGFIPAMIGWLLNFIPVKTGTTLANTLAPSIEFRAAMAIFFSALFYLIFGAILYGIGFSMGYGFWTFCLVVFPIMGYFYIVYRHITERWNAGRKAKNLNKNTLQNILQERAELKKVFE